MDASQHIVEKIKVDIFYHILNKFNTYFRDIAEESHNKILGNDSYRYFQTPLDFFQNALGVIKEREVNFKDKKFLEVGSGIGCLCGVASFMGLNAEGIELNPILYEVSKQIFPEVRFHNMNALDFNNYGDYDVIFYWLPFNNPELQQALKKKIEDDISVGSYIIMAEEESQNAGKDDRFISINHISNFNGFNNKVWQKIK
jgi:hypothetical protein